MSAKPALLAPSAKPADALAFDPESPEVEQLHCATVEAESERAKAIRAACSGHIGEKALKHPDFNFETDISVWRFRDGRIVWTSPIVRASNRKLVKPIERNGLPTAVVDAFKNGDNFKGLPLPSCAGDELKKATRRKPAEPASNAMPASDALLDQLAQRAQDSANGHANEPMDVDEVAKQLIQETYAAYAGNELTFLHGAARAGLFAHGSAGTPAGDQVASHLAAKDILPGISKTPGEWVGILRGKRDGDAGTFTQRQAFTMAAAAVYDVMPHLARAAATEIENVRCAAAADRARLYADNETYRKINVTLELENAELREQLAAAAAAAPAAAADGDSKKAARKRSGGAPAGKRAAAASSAASAPALPEAAVVDEDDDNDSCTM